MNLQVDEISNFHRLEQSDYVVDVFRTTPSISSYITAMIVSDFTHEQASEDKFSNRTVRVCGENLYHVQCTD